MELLRTLLTSKKVAATVAGIIVRLVGPKIGLDLAAVESIVYTLMAYVVGQGIADHGKEAVKVQLKSQTPPGPSEPV